MSALARYFLHEGYAVAGYDRTESHLTDELAREGAVITYNDDVEAIPAAFRDPATTMAVFTPAVPEDHPQMRFFAEGGFLMEKRSQMLGHLSEGKYVMAVAGTHGKTTTSTLIAWINRTVTGGGSAFLGGISKNFAGNLVLGSGDRLAVEADEFDRSFLRLRPDVAVITSVAPDHLDIYGTFEAVREAFGQFASLVKPGGHIIIKRGVDIDLPTEGVTVWRYSCDEPCDFYAADIRPAEGGHYDYDIVTPDGRVKGLPHGCAGMGQCGEFGCGRCGRVVCLACTRRSVRPRCRASRLGLVRGGEAPLRVLCQYAASGLYGRLCAPSRGVGGVDTVGAGDVPRAES